MRKLRRPSSTKVPQPYCTSPQLVPYQHLRRRATVQAAAAAAAPAPASKPDALFAKYKAEDDIIGPEGRLCTCVFARFCNP